MKREQTTIRVYTEDFKILKNLFFGMSAAKTLGVLIDLITDGEDAVVINQIRKTLQTRMESMATKLNRPATTASDLGLVTRSKTNFPWDTTKGEIS